MAAGAVTQPRSGVGTAPPLGRRVLREGASAWARGTSARLAAAWLMALRQLRRTLRDTSRWLGDLWELARREGIPRLLLVMVLLLLGISAVEYLVELRT